MAAQMVVFRILQLTAAGVALLAAGCALQTGSQSGLPDRFVVTQEPAVFHSNSPLSASHPVLQDLSARQASLQSRLGLPPSNEPVKVYLFASPVEYAEFLRRHYPEVPQRRACFLESDNQRSIFAPWGDWVAEDLRHEMTHGYLHAVTPRIPLWLDEGLAKYQEVPQNDHGVNRKYLAYLLARVRKTSWRPDLKRLDELSPSSDLKAEDYAESWAWVHFLLESTPAHLDLLRQYLADLRGNGPDQPLSAQLASQLGPHNEALVLHLENLER